MPLAEKRETDMGKRKREKAGKEAGNVSFDVAAQAYLKGQKLFSPERI
jgi:hypothetical protein